MLVTKLDNIKLLIMAEKLGGKKTDYFRIGVLTTIML